MKSSQILNSNKSQPSSKIEKAQIYFPKKQQIFNKIEIILEEFIFGSRWLLTPFYICLVLVIGLLFVEFFREFVGIIPLAFHPGVESNIIVATLNIIDLLLMANLLLIIVHSGYESFVSKLDIRKEVARPDWMSKVSYSSMKIKVIASIVTISAIELLESFINVNKLTNHELLWQVTIHMTFVISGLVFVVTDKMMEQKE
jgi:uncharacterized protein (TIGR00645 family)